MLETSCPTPSVGPVVQAYLLGSLDLPTALAFQRRLVYDISGEPNTGAVILCEHPASITIGRAGSASHIRSTSQELQAQSLTVEWIARGGGVIRHTPGQVVCYPILSLAELRMTPAVYIQTLCEIVAEVVRSFGIGAEIDSEAPAIRIRGRRVAQVGVAIRRDVTSFGVVMNVTPDLELFRDLDIDGDPTPMTSLQRECPVPVRVQAVRQRLLEALAERFHFARVSVFHSHPTFLPRTSQNAIIPAPTR